MVGALVAFFYVTIALLGAMGAFIFALMLSKPT